MKLKSETQAECEFCVDNYGELSCQFYRPRKPDFKIVTKRNGKTVVCECCDYSDEEATTPTPTTTTLENYNNHNEINDAVTILGDVVNEANDNRSSAKVENDGGGDGGGRVGDSIREPATKVQPGWYGKGYRKNYRKKKKN